MPSNIHTVFFFGSNPDVCSFSSQSSSVRSAASLLKDLAVTTGRSCSSPKCSAASRIVVFTCKTSGKSTSKTLLSFKQLRRYALASIPAGTSPPQVSLPAHRV